MAFTQVTSGLIASVANTSITGLITSAQIANITNSQITGTIGSSQLTPTAVVSGVYGGASTIPVVNINSQGQIVGASNVTVTVANTQITGTITTSQGGTNLTSFTSNGIIYASSTSVLSQSPNLTFNLAGYLSSVWSDKVSVLGNTGTATTISANNGNVFTATLNGNCTFTLSAANASANSASSFTLILTNDATPSRTVAWSGGTFKFPGGAASLTRTTTANAVDVWFFFTPDGGTNWYGSIPMANLTT